METRQARSHRETAERYVGTACDLDIDAEWPYECVAKDEHELDHYVTVCRTHKVWWHDRMEESGSE